MAAKKSGRLGTVATVVFTSVVGPLMVQVGSKALKGEDSPDACSTNTQTSWSNPCEVPTADLEVRVIAKGVGTTPESAWNDAVANGLRTAILSELATHSGLPARAGGPQNTKRMIKRCVDLGCQGSFGNWQREVVVILDRGALMRR